MSRSDRFPPLRLLAASILLAVLLLGLPSGAARADWPPPPPHGSSLYPPEGGARVQMVTETVLIEAAANRADRVPYAVVDAAYLLRNRGAEEAALALRYPLSALERQTAGECELSAYQPLRYLQVWLDGRPVSYRIEYAVVPNTRAAQAWDPAEVTRACWASFTAVVPAGADITVRLRFEQEAGVENFPGYAVYPYALGPGAGWDGPVERSEIVFRAPWFLTEENLIDYAPRGGQVNMALTTQDAAEAKEIRWVREDFEPGEGEAVRVQILNPPVYQEINRGRMLYMHSRRGEAWGRYGLAAKRAILAEGGFRGGRLAERLYRESYDAYTRTLELYPWNADWHAGFAELLCTNAAHPTFDLDWSDSERWTACAGQIQAALRNHPAQPLALALLEQYGADGRMGIENGKPVFPILTQTVTPTESPLPSSTPLPPTATVPSTKATAEPEAAEPSAAEAAAAEAAAAEAAVTEAAAAEAAVAEAAAEEAAVAEAAATSAETAAPAVTAPADDRPTLMPTLVGAEKAQGTGAPGLCGAALLPLLGLILHLFWGRIRRGLGQ